MSSRKQQREEMWQEWLDEEVCDYFSNLAANLNNEGVSSQEEFFIREDIYTATELAEIKKSL